MMKWLTGLTIIAALAWLPSATDDTDNVPLAPRSASTDEMPPTAQPAIGGDRSFSIAEIRWCMSEYIRLEAIQPRLATRRAIDYHNELADDYNRRCNSYQSGELERKEAERDIDSARPQIVAAALEDIQRLNNSEVPIGRTQELLELLGYDPGSIDGVYGTQTRTAIEAFQRGAGISVDGLLSQELLGRLRLENARRLAGRSGRGRRAPTVDPAVPANAAVRGDATVPAGAAEPVDAAALVDAAVPVDVVVLVTDAAQAALPDAQVRLSGDEGFHDDGVTDERGRVRFATVPAGKLDVNVQRDAARSRFTLRITEEPHQEVLIILPTQQTAQ